MEAIKVDGLTKNFNGVIAVDQISFSVPVGNAAYIIQRFLFPDTIQEFSQRLFAFAMKNSFTPTV